MLGQSLPEFSESLDLSIVAVEFDLEFIGRMDINNDGQAVRQDHVQRVVEIFEIVVF